MTVTRDAPERTPPAPGDPTGPNTLKTTRSVYRRIAEAAEGAVQAFESSVGDSGIARAVVGDAGRRWSGLRGIAHQVLVATDTNLKAGFDCAERLLQASGPREVLAIQAAYLRDQSQRSARQMIDLHRIMGDVVPGGGTSPSSASWAGPASWPREGQVAGSGGQAATGTDQPFRRGRTRGLSQGRFHEIAYVEWGQADSPHVVICVHGLTRQGRDFDALAGALAEQGYRVVCPDVVGRGRSGWLKDPEAYGLPQYASDMAVLIAHLGVERVDWVGTSMGGMIGMALAAAEGTPIRRLVVNDIGPFLPHAPVRVIGNNLLAAPARYADLAEAEARLRRIHAPFGPLTDAQWRHLTAHSVVPDEAGGLRPHYDPGIANAFRPGRVYDVSLWEMWDAIAGPVLLLRGATSDLLLAETAEEMTRRGPRARLVTIPGCGHAPALLDANQIRIVTDWLGPAR